MEKSFIKRRFDVEIEYSAFALPPTDLWNSVAKSGWDTSNDLFYLDPLENAMSFWPLNQMVDNFTPLQ